MADGWSETADPAEAGPSERVAGLLDELTLARVPQRGRNFEYYSADPELMGEHGVVVGRSARDLRTCESLSVGV